MRLDPWDGMVVSREVYEISLEPSGLILTRPHGFWTSADVDGYFALLTKLCAEARTRFGRARVLSDSRNFMVQTPEVVARFENFKHILDAGTDKVALVAESELRKMQIKRGAPGDHYRLFASIDEARDWLLTRT